MSFREIDLSSWSRKEYYEHYHADVPCTYSVTVDLDITAVREAGLKLYPTMLYLISAEVNRREEFRVTLSSDGVLGVYDRMHPCYTVFHKENETFSNLWTEFDNDYRRFCASYEEDLKLYGGVLKMDAKQGLPENNFPVSMIPWVSFSGFNLNLKTGFDYLTPIFTMGKVYERGGRSLLPFSVQVHHAVCDGFHVSRLIAGIQEGADTLPLSLGQ